MTHGFVETGLPTHQKLHVDYKDVDIEQPFHQLILRMPLDKEGIFLQSGKVKVDEEKKVTNGTILRQDLIFIPFGTAVSLPENQFHGSHYSKQGNFGFYSVFVESNWSSSNLQEFESYLS